MDKFNPCGIKPAGNSVSLLIEINDSGDGARVKWSIPGSQAKWQEIKHNSKGEMYVTHYGYRYLLNEFIKIEGDK